jgi:hypothetical protein
MKFTGDRLGAVLEGQIQTVTLVDSAGVERHGISPRFAAAQIGIGEFVGYGRNGMVERIVSTRAPRRGPFVTGRDLAVIASAFPRLPKVQRNAQDPGAKEWAAQPTFAGSGQAGKVSTVHFG